MFRAVGPGAALVRPVHEAVTRSVFAGLGLGTRTVGMAAAAAVGSRDAPALSTRLVPSASGRSRTRRIPFEDEYGMHLGAATHFTLLNHPAVYERLRDWLAVAPALA